MLNFGSKQQKNIKQLQIDLKVLENTNKIIKQTKKTYFDEKSTSEECFYQINQKTLAIQQVCTKKNLKENLYLQQ